MRFITVILKNLLRRKVRSVLTIVGISIGVAAVVAMTAIAWGFEKSWTRAYTARGTDLAVTKTSRNHAPEAPEATFGIERLPGRPNMVRTPRRPEIRRARRSSMRSDAMTSVWIVTPPRLAVPAARSARCW